MANEAGQGCVARGSSIDAYTFVSQGAPASIGGSCNKLEVYTAASVGVGSANFAFFTAVGNVLTPVAGTRIVGLNTGTAGGCQTFVAGVDFTAFTVYSGNYLGCYCTENENYALSGGSGLWYVAGDKTDTADVTFSNDADGIDALSADIVTAGGLSIPVAMYNRQNQ